MSRYPSGFADKCVTKNNFVTSSTTNTMLAIPSRTNRSQSFFRDFSYFLHRAGARAVDLRGPKFEIKRNRRSLQTRKLINWGRPNMSIGPSLAPALLLHYYRLAKLYSYISYYKSATQTVILILDVQNKNTRIFVALFSLTVKSRSKKSYNKIAYFVYLQYQVNVYKFRTE